MDSKRKARPSASAVPKPTAIQLPLPGDSGAREKAKRVPRLPDGQDDPGAAKRAVHYDRLNLERFLKRMGYTADEWEMRRRHYLEEPLNDDELRSSTWKVAKRRHCGPAVEVALERQKKLNPALWFFAFLMARGEEPEDIRQFIGIEERRYYMLLAELRSIVRRETHADSDSAVTRWFLGL